MNSRQKYTISLAGLFIVVLILFPPYFGIDVESEGRVHAFIGYRPIWSPPSAEQVYEILTSESASDVDVARLSSFEARLNVVRLAFNVFVLVIVAVVALIVFRQRSTGT